MLEENEPVSCLVLLATFNGERFLDAQLRSIEAQNFNAIDVLASDDGSTDRTVEILHQWRSRWSKGAFEVARGPGKGFAANFRSLALNAGPTADYVAFSDQDDVWDTDKLASAIETLNAGRSEVPSLYMSRTRLIDEGGAVVGMSPLFRRMPGFRNAIVQSIGGGNTMVHNQAGFELFRESARRTEFITHDWWSYIICTGAGGAVHYDTRPHISYRQHGNNLVGQNTTISARFNRVIQLLTGRFSRWMDANLIGLDSCSDLLNPEARAVVETLRYVRNQRGLKAWQALAGSGIYRQTNADNVALRVAASLGKI